MEGCVNVEGRVIFWDETLGLAILRFGEHATIHEHPGETEAIVSCLEGRGYTSVGGQKAPIESGQIVRWPAGIPHRLWTEGSTMTTLMCERPAAAPP
jgi:quercetin dioxygenase-like cupin family protein